MFNNKVVSINKQFEKFTEKKEEVILRGKKKVIYYMSAPLKVVSHKKKYRIIALKYEGESEYRYIIDVFLSNRNFQYCFSSVEKG